MNNIVTSVFEVFSGVGDWFVETVQSLVPMFYGETGLTILGTLSVVSLGISIIMLLLNVIGDFLHFKR